MPAPYIKNPSIFGILDPRDYGAVPGGVVDCAPGIQAALNACPPGGMVLLGPGYWLCNENLYIPNFVTLKGTWEYGNVLDFGYGLNYPYQAAGTVIGNNWVGAGTTPTAKPFVTIGSGSMIDGIAFYDPILGQTTNARPYVIGTNYSVAADSYIQVNVPAVRNVGIINCYQGIRYIGFVTGLIENCLICALSNAIWLDQSQDFTNIRNVKIEPFFYDGSASWQTTAFAYQLANLTAIKIGRMDCLQMSDIGITNGNIGILLANSVLGTTPNAPWVHGTNVCVDIVNIGIQVNYTAEQGVSFVGGSITTITGTPSGVGVNIASTAGHIKFVGTNIESEQGHEVAIAGGKLILSGCSLNSYNGTVSSGGSGVASITATGSPQVICTGCDFDDARPPIYWNSSTGYGVFSGNIANAAIVDSNSRVTSSGNVLI